MSKLLEAMGKPYLISTTAVEMADGILQCSYVPPPLYERDRMAKLLQHMDHIAGRIRDAAPDNDAVKSLCESIMLPDPYEKRARELLERAGATNAHAVALDNPVMRAVIAALRDGMGDAS